MDKPADGGAQTATGSAAEVFWVFLKLGLTSFGGPIAHLGYFRTELVERRRWLDERILCRPGRARPVPARAGEQRGGDRHRPAAGGLRRRFCRLARLHPPSAVALVLFAYGLAALGDAAGGGWLHGLKVVAVAAVAQAVLGMMRSLAPDRERATLAVAAAVVVSLVPGAWAQIAAIVQGAVAGMTLLRDGVEPRSRVALPPRVSRTAGALMLLAFLVLLIGLPLLAAAMSCCRSCRPRWCRPAG